MHEKYDLAVIGGGPGGYVSAIRAAQAGLKTAIIESDALGGTCLNRGCIPTKVIIHSAYLYHKLQKASQYGIKTDKIEIDYKRIQERKSEVIKTLANGVLMLLKKNKADIFSGHGRFIDKEAIAILRDGEETKQISSKHIIIATGGVPSLPPNIEIDGKTIITSNEALSMDYLPKSVIILGGGTIGVEFASIYNTFGSKVTILEMKERILPNEDRDISLYLKTVLQKKGVTILTSSTVLSVQKTVDGAEVSIKTAEGIIKKTADIFLAASGRKPYTDGLDIGCAGVEMNGRFIKIDKNYRTTAPNVYAVGDITGKMALAHAASAQGIAVVNHIMGKGGEFCENRNIPRVTYSIPQAASVGYTQQEAEDTGFEIKVGKFPFSGNGKAVLSGEEEGFVKIISEAKTGKIIGVHMIGHNISELIGGTSLWINSGMPAEHIIKSIYPHPTMSEALSEALYAVLGKAIHS